MEIVLVRHGQPEWSRDDVSQVDPALTSLGHRQAELTAKRLGAEHFDELLVSTATRAQQTADPLRQQLAGVHTEDRDWLHEIQMPAAWQGTPAEEVNRALRDARFRSRDEWWEGMPGGGETFHDFHARVTIGLVAELAEAGIEHTDDGLWRVPEHGPRMLCVAHAGTNSVVLSHLLGIDPEPWEWERFASNHASVTIVRATPIATGHIFSLQLFSDVSHLPPDLVTD
jgi:broad specificity phosphatase PhoE